MNEGTDLSPERSGSAVNRRVTIVIPAYNESARLGPTLDRLAAFFAERDDDWDAVVIDDGSSDGTADLARERIREGFPLQLLVNAENRGKGFSVRRGMMEASGDVVLMSDADLSCPIEEIDKLLSHLDQGCDVVIGSRDMPDSKLDPPQPRSRRLMAWALRTLRRRMMLPQIRDTQCGFKLFRREAAREIFSRLTIDGWLFDCEALVLAERLGYEIREVGVVWRNDLDSRVRPMREPFRVLADLRRIRRRARCAEVGPVLKHGTADDFTPPPVPLTRDS